MTRADRLERVRRVPREDHHPTLQETHRVEGIDRATLFYVKEYGHGTSVWRTILRESLPVLVLASLVSSLGGGVALEYVKEVLFTLTPFLILLPALNDMIGDFGIVVSSRVSEILYQTDVQRAWWREADVQRLFVQVIVAALITAVVTAAFALGITAVGLATVDGVFALKVVGVVVLNTLLLTVVVFCIAVGAGIAVYRRRKDPNNVLIPVTTAVADVLNILLLTGLVLLVF